MKYLSIALLAAAGAQPVLACDLCAIYSATEAQGGGGGFYSGVAEQFTHFGTVQQDSAKLSNDANQHIESFVSQLFAGYNLSSRLSVQLNLPVIYREYSRPRGSVIDNGTESGIGDISLTGNWLAWQKLEENFDFNWTILGGIKLPTGDSSRLNEPDVDSIPPLPDSGIGGHDLALGSGSVDGVVGTSFSARWKRGFASGSLQYAIRTRGDYGHRYANDLTWSIGPGVYLALNHDYTLTLQAVVSGETKGKDTFYGVPDGDSAEAVVYAGPQIGFTWSSKLSAQLGADLPVNIHNTGVQVVPDYRIRAALTWHW